MPDEKLDTWDKAHRMLIERDMKLGRFDEIKTDELELWIHKNPVANNKLVISAKFELQKRQVYATIIAMEKSAKWAKWMTIATAIMAIATVGLAIITYIK